MEVEEIIHDGKEDLVSYIKVKECNTFIKRRFQKVVEGDKARCGCGYRRLDHSETAIQNSQRHVNDYWNEERDVKKIPTNAYGEIEFVGFDSCVAQYVRVADDTPMEGITKLFNSYWKLQPPGLIISVVGSARKRNMEASLMTFFCEDLLMAAVSTNACFVTDGVNSHVTKCVVEAVTGSGVIPQGTINMIGVVNWGFIGDRQLLLKKKDQSGPVKLTVEEESRHATQLEPHHTHFILVDDGTQKDNKVEVVFRDKFEEEIGKQQIDEGETVPACLLVLGGDLLTLQTVYRALQRCTSTIVIKGSGGTADILADAYQNAMEGRRSEGRGRIKERIKTSYGEYDETYLNLVEKCANKWDLLYVYDVKSTDENVCDLLKIILTALLENEQFGKRLTKAVESRTVDKIILQDILTDDFMWRPGLFDAAMLMAIKQNRLSTVKLFYEIGFSLERFLRLDKLLELYKTLPRYSRLLFKTGSTNDINSLKDVTDLIAALVENPYKPKYRTYDRDRKNDVNFSVLIDPTDAAHELFVWATLRNYHELSKIFWEKSKEFAIARALFAQNIVMAMKKRAQRSQDNHLASELQPAIDGYGELAVDLLKNSYKWNESLTHKLLIRNMEHWGNTSCINMALKAENSAFLSHRACQFCFNSALYDHIQTDVSLLWIMLSTIFPPLIFALVRFTKPFWRNFSSKPGKTSVIQRFHYFYKSPIVKVCLNAYFCVIFHGLYSYVLLVELSQEFHWLEAVLIAWVFTLFVDELRQLRERSNYKSKALCYSILDIGNTALFFIGYGLRFGCMELSNPTYLLDASRVVLSLSFITFSFRALRFLMISKNVGPLLIMIFRMMKDLLMMMTILLVFIVAYAVASEAILYPESKLSWFMVYNLPRKAYWQVFGNFFLEDIEGVSECTNDPSLYNNGTMLRCPSDVGRYFVPVLLGFYVLMTNVMLVNVLIALLTSNYQRYRNEVDITWNLTRLRIVHEYTNQPFVLPHPLSVIPNIYSLIRNASNSCSSKDSSIQKEGPLCKRLEKKENIKVTRWESGRVRKYFECREKEDTERALHDVKSMVEKVDQNLARKVEDLQEKMVTQNSVHDLGAKGGENQPPKDVSYCRHTPDRDRDAVNVLNPTNEETRAALCEHSQRSREQGETYPMVDKTPSNLETLV